MSANLRMQASSYPHQISFGLFVLTLLFAPLAFGTTETWSMATLELLVALTGLLYFFPRSSQKSVLCVPGLLPLLLLLIWIYLQCIPLPPYFVECVAPRIFTAYQPILDVKQTSEWIPLTVNQKATLLEALRISSYVLFYILTVQFLSSSKYLRKIVTIVITLSLFIAFIALLQKFSSPHKIYWFRQIPASAWQGAFGPWVYPNQYAGFMVMVCPLAAALFFYYRPDLQGQPSIRQRFVDIFSQPKSHLHILLGFGLLLILTSIFLSNSRGGMLSISCALLLFLFLSYRKKTGNLGKTALLFICCFLFAAAWFNRETVLDKFLYTFSAPGGGIQDGRLRVWKDSLGIIADYPLTGSGFGSFADIYPGYKSTSDIYRYAHAHNDYLELLTDGGLLGFLLATWFMATILKTGIRQMKMRRDTYAFLIATGAFCGISGILVYSVTDFNLHNGANGLYFFFLCGLLVSAGHTRRHDHVRPTLLPQIIFVGGATTTVVLCITFYLAMILLVQGGTIKAEHLHARVKLISSSMLRPEKKITQIRELLEQAIQYDPLNGRYSYALANVESYAHQHKKALHHALDATMKQPMQGEFLNTAAQLLTESDPEKAHTLHKMSVERNEKEAKINRP